MARLTALTCRFCYGELNHPPLLCYPRSPSSAQGFTDSPTGQDDGLDLNIHQCTSCGLVQHPLSPVPYFKDVIRSIAFSGEMASFRLEQLGNWLSTNCIQEKKILEVGCGRGEYLDLLTQAGAKSVFGIENSLSNIEIAIHNGFQVQHGYLDVEFTNPWPFMFDAFAIFSFMEHWPDLNNSLRRLHSLLTGGAVGLIEVPNFEFILNKNLYSEFTVDHIYYFDRSTLKRVLELNGFEVESIECIWHDYILSAKVKKRKLLDASGFIHQQQKIINELHDFLRQFEPCDVVVWGAGHQSLTVLSLAQLSTRISHVIDSAHFKQNKYTPGTQLLIKSPESLKTDATKVVLIMAAAYSDEVANQVKKDYPQIQHIAILRETGLEVLAHG